MKKHPEVIRLHPGTAPSWARLRRVIEKNDRSYSHFGDVLKDNQILDLAVSMALTVLDPTHIHDRPENEKGNSITMPLGGPFHIVPEGGEPKGKGEIIRSATPEEILTARLEKLEANVRTLMEKQE